jgi:GNAT superfamily N-acetyltransferase
MPTPASFFEPVLVCRPAIPLDTPAVLELSSHIWEGEDYVPRVWQDWLTDPYGLLAVAEYGGRIAAIGKLTRQLAESWWLEGLRVHPDFEGRGIATHLFTYLFNHWLEQGKGVIRLSTVSSNLPIHHICAKLGFAHIAEFSPYRAPALPKEGPINFEILNEDQIDLALSIIKQATSLSFSRGLMDLGWVWVEVNAQHLDEAARKRRLWIWRRGQGLISPWPEVDDGPTAPYLMLAACPKELLPTLLLDYRHWAAQQGFDLAGWNAPLHPDLLPILKEAGFTRYWKDGSVYIFEAYHPNVV